MDKKLILPVAIVVIGLIIALGVIFFSSSGLKSQLTAEEATDKVVSFINSTVLAGQGEALPIETVEESGVYVVKFSVDGEDVEWRATKDGRMLFPQTINLDDFDLDEEEAGDMTIGNFELTGDSVCSEGGRPIVYFFGSEECSHCQWEHPIITDVVSRFGDRVAFHDNMNSTDDAEIFSQYNNEGYVPAILIGCQYYRVGSGENLGEEDERRSLTALICSLTGSQPESVCSEVEDLVKII